MKLPLRTTSFSRPLAWAAAGLLAAALLPVLFVAVFGWNWLRAPVERMTLERTGRALLIGGDLKIDLGWPLSRVSAGRVTFANPAWAVEKHMVSAESVAVAVDLPQFLRRRIVLRDVHMVQSVVFLERAVDGRRNWLLDTEQKDEGARLKIDRLSFDKGQLAYDDPRAGTSLRSELSTAAGASEAGLEYAVKGRYKHLPMTARGTGGPVLAMRDENAPYPMKIDARIGGTNIVAAGTVTSLLVLSAMDMHLALRGSSLEELYPLLGLAFPATPPYELSGRIVHIGSSWAYEKFSGRIGQSDIGGRFQLETGGARPFVTADLASKVLAFEDLGPLLGARVGSLQAARAAAPRPSPSEAAVPVVARARVLPAGRFSTERWDSVDAEVTLKAGAIRRAKTLPLENLSAHLSLKDSVLILNPLKFGVAGGELDAVISLDGRKEAIQAKARVKAKKIRLAKLFPTLALTRSSTSRVNGRMDLVGRGDSVAAMLGSSTGKLGLVVTGGDISKLMMEQLSLHLWEVVALRLTSDRPVQLRCGLVEFDVKDGLMQANALVLDTEITTVLGTGNVNLKTEKLELVFTPRTKNTSPLSLDSPLYVRGSFARPDAGVDKASVALRAVGAIALGLVNPLLALLPLIDAGPGKDSACGEVARDLVPDSRNSAGAGA
jgi:AsmA protein